MGSVTIMRKEKLVGFIDRMGWGGQGLLKAFYSYIFAWYRLSETNVSSGNKIRKKPASFFYDFNGFFSLSNKV